MNTFHARTVAEWRDWLATHSQSASEIWLIMHRAAPSIQLHEAVEHALCFGWIDSHHHKHTESSSRLRFTPRKPRSTWSSLNRTRAATMTAAGLMTPAGQAAIDLAKAQGTWDLDSVVPQDLQTLLAANPPAAANFARFPPSTRRLILEWIATAKKPPTRLRRVTQTAELAARNIRAR